MATLETRFGLGHKVWYVSSSVEDIELPCRFCRGRGRLTVDGSAEQTAVVQCPKCSTKAMVRLGTWPVWRVDGPLTIGMIELRVFQREGLDNGERGENRNPGAGIRREDEERYMAWSTGVGSGSVYKVWDLFADPDEAQAEADERTARSRRGEPASAHTDRSVWWPSVEQVRVAAGFLDHRDIYEHDAAHVTLAEAIVQVAAARERA